MLYMNKDTITLLLSPKIHLITYSLWEVQEFIVLQVEVGYLCAVPNLLR